MRKLLAILFPLVFITMLVTGCDFLRSIAGRPTSKEIDTKRLAIENRQRLVEQAARDSADRMKKKEADSIAALTQIYEIADVVSAGKVGVSSGFDKKYYIVIGTFSQQSNAARLADKYRSIGYDTVTLPYKNGMTVVALCPTDSIVALRNTYVRLLADPSCPKSMWILVNG